MATLTEELVTQRAGSVVVSISKNTADNALTETFWAATSTGSTNQTVTKTVAGNQVDRDVVDARIDA